MSLHIHRAERADRLVEALGEVLSRPLPDPFATEIVCVPTHGVERWLSQRLSHRLGTGADGEDGVCAGVDFPSPHRLAARATAAVTGIEPGADPWQPHRAVWPLLTEIDAAREESWAAPLWAFLGRGGDANDGEARAGDSRGGRRWSIAQHLADLFAAYASSRPAMLLDWLAGNDVGPGGRLLGPDRRWQAELWRRLRARLELPSPAERIGPVCDRLAEDPSLSDLPERLSVFGPTRVLPDQLRLLTTLARHRDVHLWLTQPSPVLWDRISDTLAAETSGSLIGPRSADPTVGLPEHRLLAYLGRDTRELQLTLLDGVVEVDAHPSPGGADGDRPGQPAAPAAGRPRRRPQLTEPVPERRLAADDDSISLHACHGPDRQVEVLREVLVGLLADDPTLEPRDIVVMCPDIETFAPLIAAGVRAGHAPTPRPSHPGHRLRVRLADRSLRQLNPLLRDAVARWSSWPTSRMEASALLDLCATAPVARKFGFSRSMIWNGCTTWSSAPACAGVSTRSTGPRSGWPRSGRTPGPPGWTGCCSGSPWTRPASTSSAPRCRWTTSIPPMSTWSAGSPSACTGSGRRPIACGRRRTLPELDRAVPGRDPGR